MEELAQSQRRFAVDTCTDRDQWNSFVEANDGPVYALWEWGETVGTYGYDHWNLVVRDREEDSIVAGLPLTHVESRLFGSKLLSPAFAVRGSIVLGDTASREPARLLVARTKRLAADLGVDYVTFRGARSADVEGFEKINRYVTRHVPVHGGSRSVWENVGEAQQRKIGQVAEDPDVRWRVGESLADLREFYEIYVEMMRDLGNPTHSFEFFRTLWEKLSDGRLRLSMLTRGDAVTDARIDLALGSTAYQYCVVSDAEYRDRHGKSFLLWKSLNWAAENGYHTYDLARTREGSDSYTFKCSFGGSEVWYDDLHYFPGGTVDVPDPEDETYRSARAVWRHLPLPVARVLGPAVRKGIGL